MDIIEKLTSLANALTPMLLALAYLNLLAKSKKRAGESPATFSIIL